MFWQAVNLARLKLQIQYPLQWVAAKTSQFLQPLSCYFLLGTLKSPPFT